MRIPSGVTDQYIYFVAVDATDLKSRETGLSSFTVYRSRNGAAAAAMTTPTVNETDGTNMPGVYELLLDEDMTITAGNDSEEMVFHITAAGMAPVTRVIELYRPKITAGYTLGVGSDGDLLEANTLTGHTAQTGDSYARIGAAGASLSAVPYNAAWDAEIQSEVTDALNAYDPPTKAELDSGFAALNDPTAATIADSVWDETLSGHLGAGSTGEALNAAGAAGDPWSTSIPGAYGAGSAGYILGNNVDAPLSTIDTNVDAILADTNELQTDDVPGLIAALNDVNVADILTTQMTESYAADGAAPTLAQALMLIQQQIGEFAISGTTLTVKKVDGSTTAATFTLDDGTSPTSITRAT
jgi:hypothetical protein